MTAPVGLTPVTCRLIIDGAVIADGSDPAANPAALAGLAVTWGRTTTVDQPDTGTASFTLEDVAGDEAFGRLAAVGKSVEIWAVGTSWGAGAGDLTETVPDPTFSLPDGAPPSWILRPTPAAVTIAGGALRINPAGVKPSPVNSEARILPAAPGGADPAAWDLIPTAQPGQVWQVAVTITATSPGATFRVGIESWVDAGHTRRGQVWLGDYAAATPGTYEWELTPPTDFHGRWMSLIIKSATGYAWDTVPAALSWDAADPGWAWDGSAGVTFDEVHLRAPSNPQRRDVLVFAGRITDAVSGWDLGAGAARVEVTAADFTAELANRDVGAEPWPAETLANRAARIVAASGAAVTLRIDPAPGALTVTRIDVDRQQVYTMLADLAGGVDAVLWSAAHATTGQYLWIEDMQHRPAVLTLAEDENGVVDVVPGGAGIASGVTLSACDVDLDPVRWTQTNADIATRAVVSYLDQSTSPDPTERTVQLAYTAAEAPGGLYGVRRVSVASPLTNAGDAAELAEAVLHRLYGSGGWRVGGLTYRVYPDAGAEAVATTLTLLDGTTRLGAAVLLTDLPHWSPVSGDTTGGYIEGGNYTYDAGAWVLSLVLSSAAGVGESLAWDELDPGWAWDDFDAGVTWDDLTGVGPPAAAMKGRAK